MYFIHLLSIIKWHRGRIYHKKIIIVGRFEYIFGSYGARCRAISGFKR